MNQGKDPTFANEIIGSWLSERACILDCLRSLAHLPSPLCVQRAPPVKSRPANLLDLSISHSLLPPESPGELYVVIGHLKQTPPLIANEYSQMPALGWPSSPLVPF